MTTTTTAPDTRRPREIRRYATGELMCPRCGEHAAPRGEYPETVYRCVSDRCGYAFKVRTVTDDVVRLARLAIEIAAAPVDPRSAAALAAAEIDHGNPVSMAARGRRKGDLGEIVIAAARAVTDADDRAAMCAATACQRAAACRAEEEDRASHPLSTATIDAAQADLLRGACDDVIDAARYAYLNGERAAGRDETAAGMAAAEAAALARVQAIVPGYVLRAA